MLQNYLKLGYLIISREYLGKLIFISREYLGKLIFTFMTENENIFKILCML